MGRFMNTTPTVTDIVAIIERPGEWRENMANAIIASKLTLPEVQRQAIHKATRWKQGAELLQYWGFSYGTVLGATFAAMYPHRVKLLKSQSRWMAGIWASFPVPCWGWKTRPKWRYEGPISGSPAHPILWIGNTLDPATPLRNAYKMAAKFSGSVVLEQDSAGHCTYSPGSTCIAKNVRRYFHTGILPGIGNRCGPDKRPFGIA
ncbi:hypothetical protein DTO039G3_3440 [Penicillium roqueforti]|nr:hypothetical protein CBS147318_4503 [Penicillium roqueforti]KAI3173247.1 hypothetical protein DTO039G3_3440 [Penicillium roqueforti]